MEFRSHVPRTESKPLVMNRLPTLAVGAAVTAWLLAATSVAGPVPSRVLVLSVGPVSAYSAPGSRKEIRGVVLASLVGVVPAGRILPPAPPQIPALPMPTAQPMSPPPAVAAPPAPRQPPSQPERGGSSNCCASPGQHEEAPAPQAEPPSPPPGGTVRLSP